MKHIDDKKVECLHQYKYLAQECQSLQQEIGGDPDLEPLLLDKLRRKTQARRAVENAIENIPDARLRSVLRLRYVDGLKWRVVAQILHYSEMQIMRLHSQALKALVLQGIAVGSAQPQNAQVPVAEMEGR